MIKKINVALLIAFVAMLAVKGLKGLKDANASRSVAQDRVVERTEESQLAPRIYYGYWAGYTLENPISNRNGVLLDIVRAVFPKATFHHIHGDVKDFAKILREDPHAVVVGFGKHPALKDFQSAPTPLMTCPLVLMTLRTNPWHYDGVKSLDGLRILADEAFLDYKVIRDLHERKGQGSGWLRIVPSATTKVVMAEKVENGEADAFVMADLANVYARACWRNTRRASGASTGTACATAYSSITASPTSQSASSRRACHGQAITRPFHKSVEFYGKRKRATCRSDTFLAGQVDHGIVSQLVIRKILRYYLACQHRICYTTISTPS